MSVYVCLSVCSDGADSQRSSMSFEEGTYDGRQGSVMYSCQEDEQSVRSSSTVMYDQRYQQPYVTPTPFTHTGTLNPGAEGPGLPQNWVRSLTSMLTQSFCSLCAFVHMILGPDLQRILWIS